MIISYAFQRKGILFSKMEKVDSHSIFIFKQSIKHCSERNSPRVCDCLRCVYFLFVQIVILNDETRNAKWRYQTIPGNALRTIYIFGIIHGFH